MRTAGSSRQVTEQAIRTAAIDVISRYGFRAASLRMLAKEVGIQAGSLYNYISSKEEFLTGLIQDTLSGMLATLRRRLEGVEDPMICLIEFAWLHLEVHTDTRRQKEILIGNLELRNLSESYFKQVTDMRDAYSGELTMILTRGVKQGSMAVSDPRVASFALIAMLTGVSYWFSPGGRLDRADVMRDHVRFALRMVSGNMPARRLNAFFRMAERRMAEEPPADDAPPATAGGKPRRTVRARRPAAPA